MGIRITEKAEETRREKARLLRYKKPIVKEISLDFIQQDLLDIMEECENVRYYFDSDDDTLLNALDGDEDEEHEMKMMFCDLCAECERMQDDLQESYVPECFDDFFVSIGAGSYGGGLLGWDSYEQDYFGIDLTDSMVERESRKRLERLTKVQILETAHLCFKVYMAYMGLRSRYDNLKAAMDILKDENTGYLKVVSEINEAYERAEADGFSRWSGEAAIKFDELVNCMPDMAWIQ